MHAGERKQVTARALGPGVPATAVSDVAQGQPSCRFTLPGAGSHRLGVTGLWEAGVTANPELLLAPPGAVRGGRRARPPVSS